MHTFILLFSTVIHHYKVYTSEERPVSRYRRYITVMTVLRMIQL